jgi:hypothetical protein
MALTTDISLAVLATLTKDLDLGVDPSYPLNYTNQVQLSSGTSAGQSDLMFTDQRTIAASGTDDLDLAGGLTDAFGATLTFVEVTALIVKAAAGNTNNVVVGDDATAPWTSLLGADGTVTLRPGALFAAVAGVADATGYAVTATTADILQVANSSSGSSVTYDIVIIGRSA